MADDRFIKAARMSGGALLGAVFGVIMVFVYLMILAKSIGDTMGFLFVLLLVPGVVIGALVGAIAAGRALKDGPSSRVFRSSIAWAGILVVTAMILGLLVADDDAFVTGPAPDGGYFPNAHADLCTYVFHSRLVDMPRTIDVYERNCPTDPRHTVNVMVSSIQFDTKGPGNTLVLAGDSTIENLLPSRTFEVEPLSDSSHLVLRFDERARVLASASSIGGFDVELQRVSPGVPVVRLPSMNAGEMRQLRKAQSEARAAGKPVPMTMQDVPKWTLQRVR